jgi:hypothetical protein
MPWRAINIDTSIFTTSGSGSKFSDLRIEEEESGDDGADIVFSWDDG